MLIRERLSNFKNIVYKTKHGLESMGVWVPKNNNIIAVINDSLDKPKLILAHNLVTDEGDKYYAQKATGETPDNAFDSLYLSSVDWDSGHPAKGSTTDELASVISGAETVVESNYPKTNDQDADNTGGAVDVVTWKFRFAKADFSDTDIDAGAITLPGLTSWGGSAGSDVIMTGFDFTAFGKTSSEALIVYINHEQLGV